MTKKELEIVARLVKAHVDKEVSRRIDEVKGQILAEVTGMLSSSERLLLSRLQEQHTVPAPKAKAPKPVNGGSSDLDKVLNNLSSMPGFSDRVDKIQKPEKKEYTADPMLNELLNDTSGFDGSGDMSIADKMASINSHESPSPQMVTGIDGRPIDTNNPTVQKIMGILNNTDHAEKFKRIKEAGDMFRNTAPPAPRFTSDQIDRSIVD